MQQMRRAHRAVYQVHAVQIQRKVCNTLYSDPLQTVSKTIVGSTFLSMCPAAKTGGSCV